MRTPVVNFIREIKHFLRPREERQEEARVAGHLYFSGTVRRFSFISITRRSSEGPRPFFRFPSLLLYTRRVQNAKGDLCVVCVCVCVCLYARVHTQLSGGFRDE